MRKSIFILIIAVVCLAVMLSAWAAENINSVSCDTSKVHVAALSKVGVVFDGHVSKFEYNDAARVHFKNGHGVVDVFVKCYDGYLYLAYEIPDTTPHQVRRPSCSERSRM